MLAFITYGVESVVKRCAAGAEWQHDQQAECGDEKPAVNGAAKHALKHRPPAVENFT